MGFHIKVCDLPWFRDYATAKKYHDGIVPIRGRSTDLRPLGDRYAYAKTIVERSEGGASYIARCLYGCELVKFFSDGRIKLSTCGYDTQSTAAFIGKVLHHAMDCRVMGSKVVVFHRDLPSRPLYKLVGKYILDKNELTITPDGKVDARPCVIHTLDKAKMRELRKQYKPFIDYVVNMYKLTGTDVTINTNQTRLYMAFGLDSVLHDDNLELWMAWAVRIISQTVIISWHRSSSVRAVKNQIAHNIKLTHPELFKLVELPIGEVKKDVNYKYVRNKA